MRELADIGDISANYDVFFCDVWGVLHNGIAAYPYAVRALERLRNEQKTIILVTNSPRPRASVRRQILELGVTNDAFNSIVTSGDVTRELIQEGPRKLFHIGAERDYSLFDGLDIELVEEREADGVICTGLYDDETETPADYQQLLLRLRSRNLPFICANPDIQVERGDRLLWCAGALARDYSALGGRTLVAGKPHRPIYELALRKASIIRGNCPKNCILAIGDGLLTDIKGAEQFGIDSLLIAHGIHSCEYGRDDTIDSQRLQSVVCQYGLHPTGYMKVLK